MARDNVLRCFRNVIRRLIRRAGDGDGSVSTVEVKTRFLQ